MKAREVILAAFVLHEDCLYLLRNGQEMFLQQDMRSIFDFVFIQALFQESDSLLVE